MDQHLHFEKVEVIVMESILHVVKEQFRNVKLIKLMLMLCMGLCFLFSTKVCAEETASVKIVTTQPKVGSNIEVQVENVSDDADLSYQWYVDDNEYTGGYNVYIPSEDDYEHWIKVKVYQGEEEIGEDSIYFSKLPVVYINTEDGAAITSKTVYK
jgi:hypothetical protein